MRKALRWLRLIASPPDERIDTRARNSVDDLLWRECRCGNAHTMRVQLSGAWRTIANVPFMVSATAITLPTLLGVTPGATGWHHRRIRTMALTLMESGGRRSWMAALHMPGRRRVGITSILLLGSCTSFSNKMDGWIGMPVQRWLAIPTTGGNDLREISEPDEQGNRIYVFRVARDCRVFWTVDAQAIMRSWKSQGSACKYYTN